MDMLLQQNVIGRDVLWLNVYKQKQDSFGWGVKKKKRKNEEGENFVKEAFSVTSTFLF